MIEWDDRAILNSPPEDIALGTEESVEPFSIKCTTCRARLSVRKAEAIGQIFACPKCGSMVLIKRPAPEEGPSSDAEMNPSEGAPSITHPPAAVAALRSIAYEEISELLGSDTDSGSAQSQSGEECESDEFAESPATQFDENSSEAFQATCDVERVGPQEDWCDSNAGTNRQALPYVFSGIVGVALAIGTLGYVNGRSNESIEIAPANTVTPSTSDMDADPIADLAEIMPGTQQPTVAREDERRQVDGIDPTVEHTVAKVIVGKSPPTESPPIESADRPSQFVDEVTEINRTNEMAEDTANTAVSLRPDQEVVDQIGDLPKVSRVAYSVPTLPERFRTTATSAEFNSPQPPLPKVDVFARLEDSVAGMKFDAGLDDFLLLVSQISTIPITIRPDALRDSRISLDSKITLDGGEATIGGILEQALHPLKLGFRVNNGNVIVERLRQIEGEWQLARHEIGDLLDGEFTPDGITDVIRQMVAPDSWDDASSGAQLMVRETSLVMNQTESAHYEALYVLGKLRITRGLTQHGIFTRDEVSHNWRHRRFLSEIVAPRPQRIATVQGFVRNLDNVTGDDLRFTVDWDALASAGIGAQTPIEISFRRQSLQHTLDLLCKPLRLTFHVPTSRLVEITTPAAAAKRCELDFHPIDDLVDGGLAPNEVIHQLELAIGLDHFRANGGCGAILYDASIRSLMVRLPQSQQAAVDWLLGELRKG